MFYTLNIFLFAINMINLISFIINIAVIFLTYISIKKHIKHVISNLYETVQLKNPELRNKKIELQIMNLMEEWDVNWIDINIENKEITQIKNKIKQRLEKDGKRR